LGSVPPSGSWGSCFAQDSLVFLSFSSAASAGSSGRSGRVAPYLWHSTAEGNGSTSAKNEAFQPSGPQAVVAASMPLHTLPYFMMLHLL
jgi:hypothetical protein